MTAGEPIRVLIADYRDGLELLLDAADRFTVVASATDGAQAVPWPRHISLTWS